MVTKKNTKRAQAQKQTQSDPRPVSEAKMDDTSEQIAPIAESSKAAQSRQSSEHLIPPVATIENTAEPYESSELSDEEVDQLMPSSDHEESKEVSNEEHAGVPNEEAAEGPNEESVEVPAEVPTNEPTEGPAEEPIKEPTEEAKKKSSPVVTRWEDCHWPDRFSYRGFTPQAVIEVVRSYDRSKPGFDLAEAVNKEIWPDYKMCTFFTSQIKGEMATGALFHRTDGMDSNSAAKFLFAGLSRTQRDLESMPVGSNVSGDNLTMRMKRNARFWVRQQDLFTDADPGWVDPERQMQIDQERERAWALDVVHDAVPEWTPELMDAFKTISAAVGVDPDELYPNTFRQQPPEEEMVVPDDTLPEPSVKGRKGKKRARKGDEPDDVDDCAPGTAANGRRVRARKAAATTGDPPAAKKTAAKKSKAAPRRKGRK